MPMTFPLPRSTPEAQGISSTAIVDFIAGAEQKVHSLHSYMLLRHGQVVAEGWWYPWRAEAPHMLFSLSKSFTSTAVGQAVAEGRLSADDRVLSFFPDKTPRKMSDHLLEMKVRHLLTMTTGHDQDTTEAVFNSARPVNAFLTQPVVHMPGTHFLYNTGATFVLSAILQMITGQTLLEYLTPRLLEPLGIEGATWESHPCGVNFGGMGLSIKTEDIARFGQLYLQKGRWNGCQVVPETWVDAATQKQVSNGNDPNSDWTQGYGYLFWRCRHNFYRGDGAFGQYCVVMPDQQAVLAITAGVADMQQVLNLVWEKLLPAFLDPPATPVERVAPRIVNQSRMILVAPQGEVASSAVKSISGKMYTFEPNYDCLERLQLDFTKDYCKITYRQGGPGERCGLHHLTCGYESWMEGVSSLGVPTPHKVAASGAWTARDTFTITMCYYETPFILTFICRFEGEHIFYDCKANVAFGPLEHPQLVGTIASQIDTVMSQE